MYYKEIRLPDNRVLSCDNVRVKFAVDNKYREQFERIFADNSRVDIRSYPQDLRDYKYKYLWVIDYGKSSMTVGYVFNGSDAVDRRYGYLDFNPNKIGSTDLFWADYEKIKACCPIVWEILRIDVALDIPAKRENVFLVKDNRFYSLDAYSLQNKTEYLGKRSKIGFVKVYNKSMESKLDYDLTRIEVTCEPTVDSYLKSFPCVYDLTDGAQIDNDLLTLNDTDLAIVRLCIEVMQLGGDPGMMIFNSMSLYKKQKLRNFILPKSCLVSVGVSYISRLQESVRFLYC